jgi:hypothetical protein
MMSRKALVPILAVACVVLLTAASGNDEGRREFAVAAGGMLKLDFNAGGSVEIRGTGGSSIVVDYALECKPECGIEFDETGDGLKISTRFVGRGRTEKAYIELEIEVPRSFDVDLHSSGGGLTIDGVDGTFTGKTKGGELVLHNVNGEAKLTTMGGRITLTDSSLDGFLKTMGGKVLFENVIGNVKGSSNGGSVRYKNVQRRDGNLGSPPRVGDDLDEISPDTVQISTMGGGIEVEDAPEGADVHTMGGNIEIRNALHFARAKTMGGDILIDSVDGWVHAVTMSGDIEVHLTGDGGDVLLSSNSGHIDLCVPSRFGMDLELQVARTRNSRKEYEIVAPGELTETVSPDWDYDHGTPRKYLRRSGSLHGGGNRVKIETINGDIIVREGC